MHGITQPEVTGFAERCERKYWCVFKIKTRKGLAQRAQPVSCLLFLLSKVFFFFFSLLETSRVWQQGQQFTSQRGAERLTNSVISSNTSLVTHLSRHSPQQKFQVWNIVGSCRIVNQTHTHIESENWKRWWLTNQRKHPDKSKWTTDASWQEQFEVNHALQSSDHNPVQKKIKMNSICFGRMSRDFEVFADDLDKKDWDVEERARRRLLSFAQL